MLTVVLGPNGAGKSTLLRILAGELRETYNRIRINGRLLEHFSPQEAALQRAVLTQHYSVNLPFSCEEIIMMGRYPHFRHAPAAPDMAIVRECMEETGVSAFAKRLFNTLSGGEQQRVQLTRVLTQLYPGTRKSSWRQKMLLLDEPTSSMDYPYQHRCMQLLRQLARKGCTVVAVLHDLNLAAQYADMILLLRDGHLLHDAAPAEVLQPHLVSLAYGMDIDVLHPDAYPFPLLLPALHDHSSITQPVKTNHYAYPHQPLAER
ncbi:heme ABC transporter ATP-binding protein [Compostibacter hankyongensis]|uniref:Heme ABC transporter ATP-binding protein n=2 Tax=Compostibacter hankyongensis TaxID=1007089 RepID=A0ABP8FR54_9BACT